MLTQANGGLIDYLKKVSIGLEREKERKKMPFGAADVVEEKLWRMATDVAASLPLVRLRAVAHFLQHTPVAR